MTTTEASSARVVSYHCFYRGTVCSHDKLKVWTLKKTSLLGMRRGGRGSSRGQPRTVPTAEELDAELDAYVNKVK